MYWTDCAFVSEQDGEAEERLICVTVDQAIGVNFKMMEICYLNTKKD